MTKELADRPSVSPADSTSSNSWLRVQMAKRRKDLESIVCQVRVLSLVLRHANAPWHAKTVAGCAVAYLLSPIQLIPTFIPLVGQMDDLFVLFIGMKLVKKLTPVAILDECEAKCRSSGFVQGASTVVVTHREAEPLVSSLTSIPSTYRVNVARPHRARAVVKRLNSI
jgi:uncharacterized membrane protein YkvA (DUF1232 family)